MKILKMKIAQFGQLSNKQIQLEKGINICYGENEAGKSTLFHFIKAMLFGLERGRGRASSFDDFTKFSPFELAGHYGGILEFEKGQKSYVLERFFDKGGTSFRLLCVEDKEERMISKEELASLLDGISIETFENTVSIGQLHAETTGALQKELLNYATNFYATGSNEFQIEEAKETLEKRIKEIGKAQKVEALKKQDKRNHLEQEASFMWRDIRALLEEEEAMEPQREIGVLQTADASGSKWRVAPWKWFLMVICTVAPIVLVVHPFNYMVSIVIFLASTIYAWNRLKEKKPVLNEEGTQISQTQLALIKLQEQRKEKQIRYDFIMEQLEEFDEWNGEQKELHEQHKAVAFALERMQLVSKGVQSALGTDLNERVSQIVKDLTEGKYEQLVVTADMQLYVVSEGRKISLWQLSKGTVEQCYFALRMAAAELLLKEPFPYVLDDTFVYYDDRRLGRALKWLNESGKQVIIMTCQKRERQIMEELDLPYHYIEIKG